MSGVTLIPNDQCTPDAQPSGYLIVASSLVDAITPTLKLTRRNRMIDINKSYTFDGEEGTVLTVTRPRSNESYPVVWMSDTGILRTFTSDGRYTNVDGSLVRHGLEDPPSGSVVLHLDYYNAEPIVSIDSFEQDSAPNNVFPRYRLAEKVFVTTKRLFDPGSYFIQYLSYKVEV